MIDQTYFAITPILAFVTYSNMKLRIKGHSLTVTREDEKDLNFSSFSYNVSFQP